MNGCLSAARCDDGFAGVPTAGTAHYEVKPPFSAPGGGELWSYLFGQEAKRKLTRLDGKQSFDRQAWMELVRQFISKKRTLGPTSGPVFSARTRDGEYVEFTVGKSTMERLHTKAFKSPWRWPKGDQRGLGEIWQAESVRRILWRERVERATEKHSDCLFSRSSAVGSVDRRAQGKSVSACEACHLPP